MNQPLFRRMVIVSAALAGFLMFSGAPRLRADADSDCQRRISRDDQKLDRAISQYGYESRQANNWRRQLQQDRERCWNNNHKWWDAHDNRWHNDRDWDDHDHDRDRFHPDRDHDRDHDRDRDHDKGHDRDHDKDHDRDHDRDHPESFR